MESRASRGRMERLNFARRQRVGSPVPWKSAMLLLQVAQLAIG